MSKRDFMLRELRGQLGDNYVIRTIDFEQCLYRDFGNGFNVEISGVDTTKANKPATLYLWFGDESMGCMIVKTVHDVARSNIGRETDELFDYTEQLIRDGLASCEDLFKMAHLEPLANSTN